MIKAILFDMDGVLVDAKPWHYDSFNMALARCGFDVISMDSHIAQYDGLPTKKKIDILAIGNQEIAKKSAEIEQLKQKFTADVAKKYLKPEKRLTDTIIGLKKDGYKMAVCSNSIANTVNLFMELAGIKQYFDILLSNQDVKNPKPHHEIYTAAMEKLNVKPHECLILEDNPHGLQAAYASHGYVMKIESVEDVTYNNIIQKIHSIK